LAIFGKKTDDTKKTDTRVDDLPEELPSLAEEIVEQAEQPKSSEQKTDKPTSGKDSAIPEELPDIEPDTAPLGSPGDQDEEREQDATQKRDVPAAPAPPVDQDSFFRDIETRLNKAKNSTQVLKEMRQYWIDKIEKQDIDMPSLIEVEKKIKAKIRELGALEKDWVADRKQLDRLRIIISNNEAEIELKTKELVALKREHDLMKQVQDDKRSHTVEHHRTFKNIATEKRHHYTLDKAFVLKDGRKIYSLKELANIVSMMTMDEFRHYTHPENHFTNWIRDVFHNQELSSEVAHAKSPMQMASVMTRHL